ncbi:MAG TPA: hypothetical protein VFK38_00155 [Candidatus Limnocylindrales bacterium]|nr:hypothetical protein [Candidatus Limnocylindrales bacterium]
MSSTEEARTGPLRVWLEPGYDHGRFGAWMLDWPGAFAWRDARDAALAAAPEAVRGFVAWLARHGEEMPRPGEGVTVVEEVPARWLEDGYEINATFAADHRAVTAEELAATIRRLDFARDDLLEILGRLRQAEAAHGRLGSAPDGDRRSRSARGVLRHLGGAEIWLAGRLDRTLRYEGPDFDAGEEAYLAATHAWALDTLRAHFDRDPALEGSDGKGETWSLAKTCRRMVYHALDHLAELERRVQAAESAGSAQE